MWTIYASILYTFLQKSVANYRVQDGQNRLFSRFLVKSNCGFERCKLYYARSQEVSIVRRIGKVLINSSQQNTIPFQL